MATRIMAGRSTPKSSRRSSNTTRGTTTKPTAPTPTPDEARELLEIKLAQLNSLLWCCYGDGNGWFEEAGEKHRDHMLWIASDLAREAEMLFQVSAPK
ncbi:hypothetical protein SAMN05518845_112122 [Variovorax sp. YR750]|uniref:hypothetical protein n=1 Tax=Variovorax sp. YR750 TaxID=1884384 RepID=UPI0008AB32E4|nr:hypothetical protein [Variovorax sp. YR750]SEL86213.1 hypothetical protein SAMN05518845_112122 [Variovorax sp. YR750]